MELNRLFANFRRASIADQVAATLRGAIAQGVLGDPLPGEHHLARQLGVSRVSLRAALAQLASEGLIHRGKGLRTRLRAERRASARTAGPVVCVISPVSRDLLFRTQPAVLMEMRVLFGSKGIGWEEVYDAKLDVGQPDRQLRALAGHRRQICYLLLACGAPIQRWFERSGVPAVVVGSCVPGVALPSVDIDFRAVGWHAAGAIVHCGHRRIGILQHARLLAGDQYVLDGFLSYLAKAAPDAVVSRILVDADYSNLRVRLTQLAAGRRRPTALLCVRPALTLGAFGTLLQCGLRIPQDMSLVARESHQLIDASLPHLTRYSGVSMRQASRVVRMALALIAGREVLLTPSRVFPSFIAGETLGPAPESR